MINICRSAETVNPYKVLIIFIYIATIGLSLCECKNMQLDFMQTTCTLHTCMLLATATDIGILEVLEILGESAYMVVDI